MKGPNTDGAALRFIEAYNKWQTLFAYYRFKGWNGHHATQPAALEDAYNEHITALEALHRAVSGEPRPNYNDRARKRIIDEGTQ